MMKYRILAKVTFKQSSAGGRWRGDRMDETMKRAGLVIMAGLALAACQSAAGVPGIGGKAEDAMRPGLATEEIRGMFTSSARNLALQAEFQALQFGPTGAPVAWDGRGERRGNVIPGPVYRIGSRDCRDYTHTFYLGDEATVRKGTACRQGEGDWKLSD